jgi:hypothetical protein
LKSSARIRIGLAAGATLVAGAFAALLLVPPRVWPDVDCGDFRTRDQAQAVLKNPTPPLPNPFDYHRLDGDGNGVACDALPSSFRLQADAAKERADSLERLRDLRYAGYRQRVDTAWDWAMRVARATTPEQERYYTDGYNTVARQQDDAYREYLQTEADAKTAHDEAIRLDSQVPRKEAEAGLLPAGRARLILQGGRY